MNVVAKSTNFLPLLKSTSVISNGMQPVTGRGIVEKAKIITKSDVNRILVQSLHESLITGALRVSSGIGGSKLLIQSYFINFCIYFNKIHFIFRLYNHMLYSVLTHLLLD